MRGTFVLRGDKIVRKGGPEDIRPQVARSSLPRPMVISDSLNGVVNPLDGRAYDSKSAYYRTVKSSGCEILGNEKIAPRDNDSDVMPGIESDLSEAFNSVS